MDGANVDGANVDDVDTLKRQHTVGSVETLKRTHTQRGLSKTLKMLAA